MLRCIDCLRSLGVGILVENHPNFILLERTLFGELSPLREGRLNDCHRNSHSASNFEFYLSVPHMCSEPFEVTGFSVLAFAKYPNHGEFWPR